MRAYLHNFLRTAESDNEDIGVFKLLFKIFFRGLRTVYYIAMLAMAS